MSHVGGLRRPVFPAVARGVLGAGGRHRQGRQRQHRAGRGRARAGRREDRLRLFRRDRAAGARGSLARRARHRARAAGSAASRPGMRRPGTSSICRIDPVGRARRRRTRSRWLERVDRETRALDPRVMQVMASLVGGARGGAGRQQRRHAGRRRAPAGALQRLGDRRAERPARAGLRRRRRALHAAPSWWPATARWRWRARPCARRW